MRLSVILASCLILAGCAEHRLVVPRSNPTGEPQLVQSAAIGFGLGQKKTVADCTTNVIDEVRVKQNLGQSLVSLLTLGFYMPTTIEYVCANVPSPVATPDD